MSGLRVSLDQLDLDEEEIYQNARYQGKPFTGTACGEEGQEVYEIPYENGSAHGRCVWRYKKSGKLSTEDFVEHGTIIKSTSWYSPGDVVHRELDRDGLRYYYKNGVLALKRAEDCTWEYYPSGALKNERISEKGGATRYAWYGEDGVWAVRWHLEAGKRFPQDLAAAYNDGYIRENFLKLLEADDFGGHFFQWLFRDAPKKPPYGEPDTSKLSAEGRAMICAMIEYEDLGVKYRGITMAGQYHVTEARPLLEKALLVAQTPPGHWHVTGGGHEYAWTVGQAARNALNRLDKE